MKPLVWYDGKIENANVSIPMAGNRAFRYGDGIFETLRIRSGKILFPEQHWERLQQGIRVLGLKPLDFSSFQEWMEILNLLLQKNEMLKGGKIRVQLFRDGEGLDFPLTDDARMLVSCESLLMNTYAERPARKAGICTVSEILPGLLSSVKSSNRLPYILAARQARARNWEDAFVLNPQGNVADGISSSVFILNAAGEICTPPLQQGALPGVMKQQLRGIFRKLNIDFVEKAITQQDIRDAVQIFTANVIAGPVAIEHLVFPNGEVQHYKTALAAVLMREMEKSFL